MTLRAPFPWFGGKSRVAREVWERFGDVATYNEPFAGSLAVLLGRPTEPRVETVNDLDCYLANFWRALRDDPEAVAYYADWPVNEADLHARHKWLVQTARERAEQCMTDPDFYDAKVAGWWVWGQCLWIGSGWCQAPGAPRGKAGEGSEQHRRPQLKGDQGVISRHANGADSSLIPNWQIRPDLSSANGRGGLMTPEVDVARRRFAGTGNGQGAGVHRRWQGGGKGGGSGVVAPALSRQLPQLSGDAGAVGRGVISARLHRSEGLYDYLCALSARLRRVRVCCGDWSRVLTPSVTSYIGITGVFLDSPYQHDLRERCYAEDHDISGDVRVWALEHGDNPKFRIALCGYENEHGPHMPATWEKVEWKAHGGYSRSERGKANRAQERIWFSPHCLRPGNKLNFDTMEAVDE